MLKANLLKEDNMSKQNGKNYAIPRADRDNTRERNWVLLTKKDDQWHWVALNITMQTRIFTAANFLEAFEALKMEIIEKPEV